MTIGFCFFAVALALVGWAIWEYLRPVRRRNRRRSRGIREGWLTVVGCVLVLGVCLVAPRAEAEMLRSAEAEPVTGAELVDFYETTTRHVALGAVVGGGVTLTLVALALLVRAGRHNEQIVRAHDAGYQSGRARGFDDARRKYQAIGVRIGRRDRVDQVDHSEEVGS